MRAPSLPSESRRALDQACWEVEGTVSRLAKLVLHASALADRMDACATTELPAGPGHHEHVRVLRQAAEAGRRAIAQAGLAAGSGHPAPSAMPSAVRPAVPSAVPVVGRQQRRG